MSQKLHVPFPHIDYKRETTSTKISVLEAVNKLKHVENVLLQCKNRQKVQKRNQQARNSKELSKTRVQQFKNSLRRQVNLEKKIQQESRRKSLQKVLYLHETHMNLRSTHYKAVSQTKSKMKEQIRQNYIRLREEKLRHQKAIKQFKRKELEGKISHRLKVSKQEVNSREKVKSFKESRISFIKEERSKDVQSLEKKLSSRYYQMQNRYSFNDSAFSGSNSDSAGGHLGDNKKRAYKSLRWKSRKQSGSQNGQKIPYLQHNSSSFLQTVTNPEESRNQTQYKHKQPQPFCNTWKVDHQNVTGTSQKVETTVDDPSLTAKNQIPAKQNGFLPQYAQGNERIVKSNKDEEKEQNSQKLQMIQQKVIPALQTKLQAMETNVLSKNNEGEEKKVSEPQEGRQKERDLQLERLDNVSEKNGKKPEKEKTGNLV